MADNNYKPHDHYVKLMLQDMRVAREFFEQHLPQPLLELIDWESLKLESESIIKIKYGREDEKILDLLFSLSINGDKNYIYILFEHFRIPPKNLPLQILCRLTSFLEKDSDKSSNKKAPIVYPVVLCNSKTKRSYAVDIWDCFENKELAKELQLFTHIKVVDLRKYTDEILSTKKLSGILQLSMKHIDDEKPKSFLSDKLSPLIKQLPLDKSFDYIKEATFSYYFRNNHGLDKSELPEVISLMGFEKEQEAKMLTIAQQLVEEGRTEGKVEEKIRLIRRFLSMGYAYNKIAALLGYPLEEVIDVCEELEEQEVLVD